MRPTASWKFVCTCAWPPGVPKTKRGELPSSAITVLSVWIGRLPGASALGDDASSEKPMSLLLSSTPVPGATHADPNSLKTLSMSDTALPSRSTTARYVVSAVRDARWRGTVRLMGGEIFRADRSADLADRRCEALGERPVVEDRGAVRGDLAHGRRQVGLLQDLAGAREPTPRAEDARGLRVEPSTAIDEALRERVAHREALLGVLDRRLEDPVESEASVVAHEVAERGDDAGDGGEVCTLARKAARERLERERARRRTGAVVCRRLAPRGVVHEREQIATVGRAVRLRHRAHGRRRAGRRG